MPSYQCASNEAIFRKADMPLQAQDMPEDVMKDQEYKPIIVWKNVIYLAYFHLSALYGLYLVFTSAKFVTFLFGYVMGIISGVGITFGAHRLWCHRAFKANLGLRIGLMLLNCMAFQDNIYEWSRNHRVHHKFSDTNADPHNINRGFFFSHVGWLLLRKHPEVLRKGKAIDMSDLLQDPVVVFQRKYYAYLMPLMCFVLPTLIPVLLWSETWTNAYHVSTMLRYVYTLNGTWLVNSAAHCYGNRPYDRDIHARENLAVALVAIGEGWHNYHHTFPWDYRASELGFFRFNLTTWLIDFSAKLGWAYDLKSASLSMVQQRAKRTGDGSYNNRFPQSAWGWGDKDTTEQDQQNSVTYYKRTT